MTATKLLFALTVFLCPFAADAQFAKVDSRTHTELNDYLVVFCTSERKMTDSYTYIATVTGNQKSGYIQTITSPSTADQLAEPPKQPIDGANELAKDLRGERKQSAKLGAALAAKEHALTDS